MQSSANSCTCDFIPSARSFRYKMNNSSPRTATWGTPEVTLLVEDEAPCCTTCRNLLVCLDGPRQRARIASRLLWGHLDGLRSLSVRKFLIHLWSDMWPILLKIYIIPLSSITCQPLIFSVQLLSILRIWWHRPTGYTANASDQTSANIDKTCVTNTINLYHLFSNSLPPSPTPSPSLTFSPSPFLYSY